MPEAFTRPIIQRVEVQYTKPDNVLESLKSNIEIPFSQYNKINGKEFSNEYFQSDLDLSLIESYVLTQINKQGLEDTIASYEQVIKELFNDIGLTENHTNEAKIDKILKYFELAQRNKSKDERQRDLIKRAKEAEAQKELKMREALEKNYLKAKEDKKEAEQASKQYQEKVKNLEAKNEQILQDNRHYQAKINELLRMNQERIKDIEYLNGLSVSQRQKLENEIKTLEYNLQQSMERERNLTLKHNQLRQLI